MRRGCETSDVNRRDYNWDKFVDRDRKGTEDGKSNSPHVRCYIGDVCTSTDAKQKRETFTSLSLQISANNNGNIFIWKYISRRSTKTIKIGNLNVWVCLELLTNLFSEMWGTDKACTNYDLWLELLTIHTLFYKMNPLLWKTWFMHLLVANIYKSH